ncbi:hypothetical protein K4F52_007751 [Lecanicillium sp. MT-2017a]|nr:hypothetical protein K4F52_007751 [Lecanicillium sp. MT-2017a]
MSIDTTEFDPDGDTHLRALSRASHVFEDLFYGDGSRAQHETIVQERVRIVELPQDNPAALATLLYAIHSRFDKVPAHMLIDDLYELGVVAHKYGAIASLQPWTVKWTAGLAVKSDAGEEELLKAMSIYWVLGCREKFFHTTCTFVENSKGSAALELLAGLQIPRDVMGEHPTSTRDCTRLLTEHKTLLSQYDYTRLTCSAECFVK